MNEWRLNIRLTQDVFSRCLVSLFLILIDHGLDDQQKLETKANIMTLGNHAVISLRVLHALLLSTTAIHHNS